MITKTFFAILALLLSACAAPPSKPTMPRPVWGPPPEPLEIGSATDIPEYLPKCRPNHTRDCINPAYLPAIQNPLSIAQATEILAGATHRSYTRAHGTQVTYFSPDGRVYLWYPGNLRVLGGHWKVALYQDLLGISPPLADQMRTYHAQVMPLAPIKWFDLNFICFKYENSFNPAMWPGVNRWECAKVTEFVRLGTVQRETGDLFGLAAREEVPYVIPRAEHQDLDFAALQQLLRPRTKE
jgi:hypothetical protein